MARHSVRATLVAIVGIGMGFAAALPALPQSTGPSTMPNGARVPGANGTPGQGTDAPRGATPDVGQSTPVGTPSAPAEIIDRPVTPATSPAAPRGGPSTSPGTPPATTQSGPSRTQPHDASGLASPGASGTSPRDAAAPRPSSRAAPNSSPAPNSSQPDAAGAANDFPPGLADCARKVDRDERASCASRLYGTPSPGR